MIANTLLTRSSPAGRDARLTVLIFHRVLPVADPLLRGEPTAAEFDRFLGWVKRHFNVVDLLAGCDALRDRRLGDRAIAITFDDGYRDNHDVALPILRKHGVPATVFVATGYVGSAGMFNDRLTEVVRQAGEMLDLESLGLGMARLSSIDVRLRVLAAARQRMKVLPPRVRDELVLRLESSIGLDNRSGVRLMMDRVELSAMLVAGVRLGAHTRLHPILSSLNVQSAAAEIREGRDELESMTGDRVELFAYPNGRPGIDYSAEHVSMVAQAGFRYAFTTAPGAATRSTPPLELPRFTPWRRDRVGGLYQLWRNLRRSMLDEPSGASAAARVSG